MILDVRIPRGLEANNGKKYSWLISECMISKELTSLRKQNES